MRLLSLHTLDWFSLDNTIFSFIAFYYYYTQEETISFTGQRKPFIVN